MVGERRSLRRFIDAYNSEMSREARLGLMQTASTTDERVSTLRNMHARSVLVARERTSDRIPVTHEIEHACLEIWAQDLAHMSAVELLGYETEMDRTEARIDRYRRGEPTLEDKRLALRNLIVDFGSIDAFLREQGLDKDVDDSASRREAERELLKSAGVDSVDDLL